VDLNRLHSFGKSVAKLAGEFGHCEIEKGVLAIQLESGSQLSAKKYFNLRTTEGPQMIRGRGGAVGRPEQAAVLLEFFRALKLQE
jgi:hypothetical protein